MKNKVKYIIAFIFEIIIICTIMSVKIEQLMMPNVVVAKKEKINKKVEGYSKDILFESNGKEYIYGLYEGDNWESGLRIKSLDSINYTIVEDKIITNYTGDMKIVGYLSKPVYDFERVRIVGQKDCEDTYYIAYYKADGTYDKKKVIVENAKYPFMKKQVASKLMLSKDDKVYSKRDIDSFKRNLIYVALLAVAIIVLICSMVVMTITGENKIRRRMIVLNLLLIGTIGIIVYKIDLPSALLPVDNIFDWHYYLNEWRIINAF